MINSLEMKSFHVCRFFCPDGVINDFLADFKGLHNEYKALIRKCTEEN